jgi:O-antigen/teichoic acid export membrane protein
MRELLNVHLLEVSAAKIVSALAGIGFVAVAARYCEAADYGIFSLAFAMANLMSVVSVVWISQAVLRFAGSSGGAQSLRAVVLVAAACATVFSCLGLVLAHLGVWPGARQAGLDVQWDFPLLAVALSLNATVAAYTTALQRFRAYRIAEVARGALLLVLVVGVACWQAGARGLVLAYAAATLVPSVLLLRHLDAKTSAASVAPLWTVLRKFLQYGWPMTVWASLQAAQSLIERDVLSGSLSPTEFGRFMASTDVIVRGMGLALMPIVTFVHARLMATAGHGTVLDAAAKRLLLGGLKLIAIGGIGLTVVVLLARSLLARIAPGIGDVDTLTLVMLCATATLWALALIVHKPLELAQQTKRMGAVLAFAVCAQWVLLSHWVETWHALAMPMASCAAAVLYMAGCLLAIGKGGSA